MKLRRRRKTCIRDIFPVLSFVHDETSMKTTKVGFKRLLRTYPPPHRRNNTKIFPLCLYVFFFFPLYFLGDSAITHRWFAVVFQPFGLCRRKTFHFTPQRYFHALGQWESKSWISGDGESRRI